MKKYKFTALNDFVVVELLKDEAIHNDLGVATSNDKLVKPKVGIITSVGSEVHKDYKIGETYVINEFAGMLIPDPNKKILLINYRMIGAKREEQ